MGSIELTTVSNEQLCHTAEMAGNPLMWELAKRFRESSAIASAAREVGLVDQNGNLREIHSQSNNGWCFDSKCISIPPNGTLVYSVFSRLRARPTENEGASDGA